MAVDELIRDAAALLSGLCGLEANDISDIIHAVYQVNLESIAHPCERVKHAGKVVGDCLFNSYGPLSQQKVSTLTSLLIDIGASYCAHVYHARRCPSRIHAQPANTIGKLQLQNALAYCTWADKILDDKQVTPLPPHLKDQGLGLDEIWKNEDAICDAIGYVLFKQYQEHKLREYTHLPSPQAIAFLKETIEKEIRSN